MLKIKFSNQNDMEKLHLQYLKKSIIPSFDSEIKFQENNADIEKFKQIHKRFMVYCKENQEILAVGKVDELKDFYKNIELDIEEVIKSDVKYKITKETSKGKETKEITYRKILEDIFGYEDFKSKSIFNNLLDYAKHELNEKSEDLIKYNKDVQDKMIEILKNNFPEQERDIYSRFEDKTYKKEELEKEIEKLIILDITMDNYGSIEFLNQIGFLKNWSPYLFVMMSGIRVCPYCNRQYITPIFSSSGKMRADLDHFFPKSQYPYFSMSLYNLVPSCKFCNSSLKGQKEFNFEDINPYDESLDDYISFRVNPITKKIGIEKNYESNGKADNYLNYFKLETIYNYHRNQANEFVEKRLIYTDEYIKYLSSKNNGIFYNKNELQIKELIVGYIQDKEKINDEAFSKFRRDIAEQLGFIDSKHDEKLISQLKNILLKFENC